MRHKMFSFNCKRYDLNSINSVIEIMHSINTLSLGTGLYSLYAFNNTYMIITEAVSGAIKSDKFNNPQLMELFDCHFAWYYLDALQNYLQDNYVAPAWNTLFQVQPRQKITQMKCMVLGVNAHVNNDLPLALHDVLATYSLEQIISYKSDFLIINSIIEKQIPKIIFELNERNQVIMTIQQKTLVYYQPLFNIIISRWRANAWSNYQKILINQSHKQKITISAKKTASGLKKCLI